MATAALVKTRTQWNQIAPPSREFDLLLACCRNSSDDNSLTRALACSVNWDIVFRSAECHRVLPVVARALRERSDVPGSVQSALQARFQRNALQALRFSAELARVTRAFAENDMEVLALKGPTLGQLLYGDAALRQFGDLDLLVRPRDVQKAKAVLRELGYEAQRHLSPRQERAHLYSGHEHVFRLNDHRNLVELQWHILQRHYAVEFDLDVLFRRSIEIQMEGFQVRSLGPEDQFLTSCVHAAKHSWANLGPVKDIAALTNLPLDWNWLHAEATRIGILRIVVISLLLAREFFGCKFPEEIAGAREIDVADRIARRVGCKLTQGEDTDPSSFQYFVEFALAREHWRDQLRFVWRVATTPGFNDWECTQLPDWLFPLYRVIRIGRFLKRAIVTSRGPRALARET